MGTDSFMCVLFQGEEQPAGDGRTCCLFMLIFIKFSENRALKLNANSNKNGGIHVHSNLFLRIAFSCAAFAICLGYPTVINLTISGRLWLV